MTMTIFHASRLGPALALALAAATGLAAAAAPDARSYLAEGDHAGAVRAYADAVRLQPGDATALNNLAVARAAGGDYQGALALLQRARKVAPARADIGHNLAMLRGWARHYSGAPPGPGQRGATSAASLPLWDAAGTSCEGVACK